MTGPLIIALICFAIGWAQARRKRAYLAAELSDAKAKLSAGGRATQRARREREDALRREMLGKLRRENRKRRA